MAFSTDPIPPAAYRHRRGWLWKALGTAYLRCAGWRIQGEFPAVPKCITIVAPHTSNWDFLLGVAVLLALELRVSWLGKREIFRPPFRAFLRWLGGIPVDRSASQGVVDECAGAFRSAGSLMLALAPEGTRKGVSQWRTGFYRIAVAADVPIFPVGFDFREHVVQLMPLFHPCGDLESDLERIRSRFAAVRGLRARPSAEGPGIAPEARKR